MTLDFADRLQDFIDTLGLPLPCFQGSLQEYNSLSLNPAMGGRTIRQYFDGVSDKQFNFELLTKVKEDGTEGYITLCKLGAALEQLESLPSSNNSYDFQRIQISSEPSQAGMDESYYYHTLTVQAFLTTYNERI